MFDFGTSTRLVIDLHNMKNEQGRTLDPSHIYIAGFWTNGGSAIYIKDIFLSNDGETSGIEKVETDSIDSPAVSREYFTLDGRRLSAPQPGMNIVKVTDINGRIKISKVCYKI
jgi:hypothetical protein